MALTAGPFGGRGAPFLFVDERLHIYMRLPMALRSGHLFIVSIDGLGVAEDPWERTAGRLTAPSSTALHVCSHTGNKGLYTRSIRSRFVLE